MNFPEESVKKYEKTLKLLYQIQSSSSMSVGVSVVQRIHVIRVPCSRSFMDETRGSKIEPIKSFSLKVGENDENDD